MIKLDGMLMIGSAGANVGKTELACALLRKFSKDNDIIGIKVTTIKAKDGRCPRGGTGCGVCSSLEGDFHITEETEKKPPVKLGAKYLAPQSFDLAQDRFIAGFADSHKDTARLLAAGAKQVFWLRVMRTHLKEGIVALLDIIGPDSVMVCESNSLRRVVEPGLFLIVKDRNTRFWKDSARKVRDYADKIVVSNGSGFDLDMDRIKLSGGKWLLKEQAAAIILAGGNSLRMGVDKSMLPIGGCPMIQVIYEQLRGTFDQILISASESDPDFGILGAKIVPDRTPKQGPLMGIASALEVSANELNFVVACDIPRIDLHLVRRMLTKANDVDVVIPTTAEGKYEPLFAVYRKSALSAINQTLASGRRRISDVFPHCKVKYLELETELSNLNTMAEYEEFRRSI
jgi:molybdopterin-guanine dinucleotide biosynthesis protein A